MDIEIPIPNEKDFTIYSKSGCPNCHKIKNLLKAKNLPFNLIDCDDFILEDKIGFINFIKNISNTEIKTFPIIFYEGKFIGGFSETTIFIDKLLFSFEEL